MTTWNETFIIIFKNIEVIINIIFFDLSYLHFHTLSEIIFCCHLDYSSSVQSLSCVDSLWPHGVQHSRLPCPSSIPGTCSNSCPLSRWCSPTISSSIVPFSSYLQSFLASGSFLRSQFLTSSGQNIGLSILASGLPMNVQDWFPLGLTGLISLQSKGLSRVFSNTTVQKHQFFGTQLSL